jgi:predicted membrane channel-forming protein YqfA (hemolysin III family)
MGAVQTVQTKAGNVSRRISAKYACADFKAIFDMITTSCAPAFLPKFKTTARSLQ